MKVLFNLLLVLLILLAVSSGITKVMLMQQDVDFFGSYGFDNSMLMAFGFTQILGGVLLILRKTRVVGASIVAVTFLVSAVILIMSNEVPMALLTILCTLLLGLVAKPSLVSRK